jgi:RimJ/RimL family protein N-acetyltransferase
MFVLEGEKIYLKEFLQENLNDPNYFKWLRDYDVVKNIGHLEYLMPLQFTEVEKYFMDLTDSKNDSFFAVFFKENNTFIGTLKIGHINWRTGVADIGIMIGEKKYRGKGLSQDIIKIGCDYAFKKLSMRKITAGTASGNIAMCKCFERVGFKKEGIIRGQVLIEGVYEDHILYGLFPNEFYNGGIEL